VHAGEWIALPCGSAAPPRGTGLSRSPSSVAKGGDIYKTHTQYTDTGQGALKGKQIESDVHLADDHYILNGVGRYFFFNYFFYGVFVRFSTRGVQKDH
jgi:hypothetical protein